ncbi:unnamed protein product [Allacma fusca]|uniref:Uncharacterized protein n=1 Tax=Allacma fusca TaxID=39272 RepID=A0A8J2PXB3_9HEXA|nr:unnamed protein product [Allacma fusca]
MTISATPIFLLLGIVMLAVPAIISDARAGMPFNLCRKGFNETCSSESLMNDCCKSGMECKAYPSAGTNDNSTSPKKCCLSKNASCPKIGTGNCCPGFSCEEVSGSRGRKCQQFFAESSNN